MAVYTFDAWMLQEIERGRQGLTALIEQRDRLVKDEAPRLRQRYMEAMGFEEEAIKDKELDLAILRKKESLIRAALSEGKALDLLGMDMKLAAEKKTARDKRASEMAMPKASKISMPQSYSKLPKADPAAISGDYTLAREAYRAFAPAEGDGALQDQIRELGELRAALEAEIKNIRGAFPFTMEPVLESKSMMESYLADLIERARQCAKDIAETEASIEKLLQEAKG